MRRTTLARTVAVGLTLLLVGYAGAGGVLAAQETTTETAAAGTQEGGDGDANVRVAHMSPDAPPVDVLVDNETVVENLSFGNVTDYLAVSAGAHNVTIRAAGDPSTVVFSGELTFDAGSRRTIVAAGEVTDEGTTDFEPVVLEDDFTVPEENASVRLVHVSPDAPPVDITVQETNTTLFDNVSFRTATEYTEVAPGNYTVQVRPATANDSGEVVRTFDLSVEGGTVYTAFAAGYLNPDDAPADVPFQPIIVVDADGAANETTAAETTTEAANATTETGTTPGQTTEFGTTTEATGTETTEATGTTAGAGTTTVVGTMTGTTTVGGTTTTDGGY
ncbi:DUF4397 domain-containing protein [Halomicrococcus sp. NG-SE-24]|uniref:DUF4397 domain-containing protein n=1 Tax=Halomicrococcus sp. NG-SE-24 TaxID=3436928 RepID=UPI003D968369